MLDLTKAAQDVLAERRRQIEREGWSPDHDDKHSDGGLAQAAAAYILQDFGVPVLMRHIQALGQPLWPWRVADWKPKDERSNLVRATALLLAEIERRDRAAAGGRKGVDHAEEKNTPFNYLLNAFERASQADRPADHGYRDKRVALIAHVRELERDAARYRWLRDECQKHSEGLTIATVGAFGLEAWSGDDPDRAIDAALSAKDKP